MKRRHFLATTALGAAAFAAPAILRAQSYNAGTPVVNGKRVRRRLSTLAADDPFFAAYAQAVKVMHSYADDDPRSWIAQARLHADFCAHGTIEFFPWHRPYLVYFERICGAAIGDPTFALPYWDWPDNSGRMLQVFYDQNNPLNVLSWSDDGRYDGMGWSGIDTVPYRNARPDYGMLDEPLVAGQFSAQQMTSMENARTFQLLSQLTEGPHGTVHVFNGGIPPRLGTETGHFSSGLSPLDPFFWLHHSNVDRVWAQSSIPVAAQKTAVGSPGKIYSGMFHDENGDPVSPALDDQFDLSGLDYTYDFLVPELVASNTLALQREIVENQPELLEFAEMQGLERHDPTAEPAVIAQTAEPESTRGGGINTVRLASTANIAQLLSSQKVVDKRLSLTESAVGIEPQRIYARFNAVRPTAAASDTTLIKVFIDCPYLDESVPTTDPHFAGIISFFGCDPATCGPREFTVDITAPLRYRLEQGALSPTDVEVQLLSVSGDMGTTLAEHGSVELITI